MQAFFHHCFVFLMASLLFMLNSNAAYANYTIGLVETSKEGHYFHTDQELTKQEQSLELISSGISLSFITPKESRVKS